MKRSRLIKLTAEEYEKLRRSVKEEILKEMSRQTLDVTLTQPTKTILPDIPRIEVTSPVYNSKMDENTSPPAALDKALAHIREQIKDRGL